MSSSYTAVYAMMPTTRRRSEGAEVMAIINLTPDSFYAGSRNVDYAEVCRSVERAVSEGFLQGIEVLALKILNQGKLRGGFVICFNKPDGHFRKTRKS